jgi:DHA1 family multidrug resistance protein-like MFS transporter
MALLSLLLAGTFLPESYPDREDNDQEREALIDLGAWWQALLSPSGTLFALTFISTSGLMIFATVFGLYGLERFDYGPEEVGVVMMVLGLASALTQGLLVGPSTKRWGDELVIRGGLIATAIGFILLLLANNFPTVLLTTAFFALSYSITSPALLSLTSRRATAPQGITMGLSNAFISLGRIAGPILGGVVLDIYLGLPYLTGAAIMLGAFIVSLIWVKPQPRAPELAKN